MVLLTLVVIASFIPTPVAAITAPDVISIVNTKVFRHVFETSDMLFVSEYHVDYTVAPSEAADLTYTIALYDGATLKRSRALVYYGHNFVSIYYTAVNAAADLVWGSAYTVTIAGNPAYFTTIPTASYSLSTSTSWIATSAFAGTGGTQELLGLFIGQTVENFEVEFGVDLVTLTSGVYVLTAAGGTVVNDAIPGISARLDIFATGVEGLTLASQTHGTQAQTDATTRAGAVLPAVLTGVGGLVGVSGPVMGVILTLLLWLILSSIVFAVTGKVEESYILMSPIILGAAWIGLFPFVWIFVPAIIIAILFAFTIYGRLVT